MSKKNNKSNKKKSVRGNYKIEALEPRLMMDGDSDDNPTILHNPLWVRFISDFEKINRNSTVCVE